MAGSVGVALVLVGSYRAVRVLTGPLRAPDPEQPLVELIYQKRFLARGPRIVAIGGGTGLSTLLRGLKEHTSNLTAIVTVADDGGSSGVLRSELGIPPVGDIRNCIVALADAEPLMSEVLQYRFPDTRGGQPSGLAGHALGNLLIAAMTAVEGDDFEDGIRLMNRILAVRGQVVPVSPTPLTLHARLADGTVVDGQSEIMRTPGIDRVWITPDDVRASDDALAAIAEAELIVLGPGSLYTSLLPSLLIPTIREAIEQHDRRRASTSATWRPRKARRPASISRRTSRRWPPTRARAWSTSSWPTTTSWRSGRRGGCCRASRRRHGRAIARTGEAALAAGRRPGPAPDPRRRREPARAAPP